MHAPLSFSHPIPDAGNRDIQNQVKGGTYVKQLRQGCRTLATYLLQLPLQLGHNARIE